MSDSCKPNTVQMDGSGPLSTRAQGGKWPSRSALRFNSHMHRLRLLLIDDHPLFRSGLRMVLESGLGMAQVHELGAIEEALASDVQADLLLVDIFLNGMDGLTGLQRLQAKWPAATLVVVSSETSSNTAQRAIEAGAHAFVSKAESPQQMLDTIRRTVAARRPELADQVLDHAAPPAAQPGLSERQLQVLALLGQGMSNRSIGLQLHLSEHTIRWHVQAILAALGASSRSEAVFVARQQGLLP
jgi:DNA-binding NarL/FixJ family response regulator